MENKPKGKGRGRPKKEVVIPEKREKSDKKKEDEEEIVLFLNLSDSDNEKTSTCDNGFTVNDSESYESSKDIDSVSESYESSSAEVFGQGKNVRTLMGEIRKRDIIIQNLKNKINNLNTGNVLSTYTATRQNNTTYHNTNLINIKDGKPIVAENSKYDCWWCDHPFDSMPCFIPERYSDGNFYVFGNFCSFNCAATYNCKCINDYKSNTRESLLRKLRHLITGKDDPIKKADAREILLKKGGPKDIESFRRAFDNCSLHYQIDIPPQIPLLHTIEENVRD